MPNKKTQQERLKDIENAARGNNQTRLKELLQSFRVDLEQDLFEANPEETNKVLKEIETKSKQLEPTTMSDIMEIRRLIDLLARGELEEDQFGGLPTSLINPNEKVPENNIGNLLMYDDFLGVIFEIEIDEGGKKEKVERVNNLGFNVKSVEQLQKIVKETLYKVFKEQIPIEEALDRETVLNIIKSKEDLQNLKTFLKTALPKKKELDKKPKDELKKEKKSAKRPPRPSPSRGKKPIHGTATMPKERIKELREEAAGGSATIAIPEKELNKLKNETKLEKPVEEEVIEKSASDNNTAKTSDDTAKTIHKSPPDKTDNKPTDKLPIKEKKSTEPKPVATLESLKNKIKDNPNLEFIIHALTGDTEAMKLENIHITKDQLFDFLTKEDSVDAFSDFINNRKSAIQILLNQEIGGPYEPEELDGLCDALKTQIKKYLEEPISDDTAKPQGNAVETMHASPQGGNKTDKTTNEPIERPKPVKKVSVKHKLTEEEKREKLDEKMKNMANKIAKTEYKKWEDLFNLLLPRELPKRKTHRTIIINKRKQLLGIQSEDDYNQLISALQRTKLKEFMAAKNPIDAFRNTFPGERLTDENLKAKLNEKIDEVMKIIENAKRDMRVQKEKISQKKLTSDDTAEPQGGTVEAEDLQPSKDKDDKTTDKPPAESVEVTKEEKPIEDLPLSRETHTKEKLDQLTDEFSKEKAAEREEKRLLLKTLDVKLYPTVKSLLDILDLDLNSLEEAWHEILKDLQIKIQKTIDVIDLQKLRKLEGKPYLKIQKRMEKRAKNLNALWNDVKWALEDQGLSEIFKAKINETKKKSKVEPIADVISLENTNILELEPVTENTISEPETEIKEILAVNSESVEAVKATEESTAKSETVSAKPTPEIEEIIKIMENDTKIHELMSKLETIRQAFNDYDADPETLPKNIKTDLETFKKMFIKRTNNSHPLTTAGSKEALTKMYIELLNQNKPELFLDWNKTAFLKEINQRLKRVYINNKKLLGE